MVTSCGELTGTISALLTVRGLFITIEVIMTFFQHYFDGYWTEILSLVLVTPS